MESKYTFKHNFYPVEILPWSGRMDDYWNRDWDMITNPVPNWACYRLHEASSQSINH